LTLLAKGPATNGRRSNNCGLLRASEPRIIVCRWSFVPFTLLCRVTLPFRLSFSPARRAEDNPWHWPYRRLLVQLRRPSSFSPSVPALLAKRVPPLNPSLAFGRDRPYYHEDSEHDMRADRSRGSDVQVRRINGWRGDAEKARRGPTRGRPASVKILIIRRPCSTFNLRRDLLIPHPAQKRSCGLLSLA
jgi:hypothetical protein